MNRRIMDDDGNDSAHSPRASTPAAAVSLSSGIERHILASGLHRYRYRCGSYPPNVAEHDRLARFLGRLIPKLMVSRGTRMEPFVCVDGRHLHDEFFERLRQDGTTWRALLGFPMIPGLHPFRYLPIAYHINGREAWNQVADEFLGTGGTGVYLTKHAADGFLIRLIQLVFVRDGRGATDLFPVYLPEAVLEFLEKSRGPSLKSALECFEFFVGENPQESSVDIIAASDIEDVVRVAAEK